jgi:hypothetical protein
MTPNRAKKQSITNTALSHNATIPSTKSKPLHSADVELNTIFFDEEENKENSEPVKVSKKLSLGGRRPFKSRGKESKVPTLELKGRRSK